MLVFFSPWVLNSIGLAQQSLLSLKPSCRFLVYMVTVLKDHVFGGSLLDFVDPNSQV